MKRIYIESLLGLITCFLASLLLYEVFVFELSTDYEGVLKEHESFAYTGMVDHIAVNQGLASAHQAMKDFAETAKSTLTIHHQPAHIPEEIANFFHDSPSNIVYHGAEDSTWFRLSVGNNIYQYQPDMNDLVHQKIAFEDDLAWVFFLSGFMIYGVGHVFIVFRRVNRLEQATHHFADGDFSYRVNESRWVALGRLNRSFNQMADKISRLIETNRSLTNAIAHEMRTPIFRAQWQAELLSESPLTEAQSEQVRSIIEDTEEMEVMVDELLYYARLSSERYALQFEDIEMASFFELAMEGWGKESQIDLTFMQSASLREGQISALRADRKLLKRALDNIVRNGFKFARERVLIEVSELNGRLTIAIHDDGEGVDPQHWTRLFEPFYVANKARNKAKSGHGLGLSIVDQIAKQHQAQLKVGASKRLGGAVFTMTFEL